MKLNRNRGLSLAVAGVLLVLSGVAAAAGVPLGNWTAPPTWTSSSTSGTLTTLADVGNPVPFIPITPCRMADTRGAVPAPPINGGGALVAGVPRNWTITGNSCGIPAGAAAVSANFTVVSTAGTGFLVAWPQGGVQPGVAVLVYNGAGALVSNAAVVPIAAAGGITVLAGSANTHLIMDVNGYYAGASASGQGMSLTSSGINNALTLTHNGTADGLDIFANTTGFALFSRNNATVCSSICGGFFGISSLNANAIALQGSADGNTTRNIGVLGTSSGLGTAVGQGTMAAGVFGVAGSSTSTFSAGVMGLSNSTNAFAAGVYGEATGSQANGGFFRNTVGDIRTYAAFNSGIAVFGLSTNGLINGTLGLIISGGVKNFVTPHPEDPSKEIAYVAAEGPTSDVFFRGTARLQNGVAVVAIPDHFRLVAREESYMATVTVVGERAVLWVDAQGPDGVVVRGSGNVRFNYVVWGERDEFKGHEAVRPNTHFTPEALEKSGALKTYPESTRALLVKNGTINPDGTYNRTTAQRLGWNIPERPPESTAAPIETLDAKKK